MNLDPDRDNIEIVEVGGPVQIMGAREQGGIDGAVLPRAQCKQLKVERFGIRLDLKPLNVYGAPDALVVLEDFLRESEQPKAILAQ